MGTIQLLTSNADMTSADLIDFFIRNRVGLIHSINRVFQNSEGEEISPEEAKENDKFLGWEIEYHTID